MSTNVLAPDLAGERWLAADRSAMWEQARVVGVARGSAATLLRLRLGAVAHVQPGQYYLVRLAVDAPPGVVEQAYSLCSSPFPPSPEVEVAVREVPGGRVSPVLARRVEVDDLLELRGPFGFLTWTERDGGPLGLIGAGSGLAPLTAIVRYAAARGLEVPMTLLSSSRDRGSALFGSQLEELARDRAWFTLTATLTRDPADRAPRYHRRIDADMLAEVFTSAPHDRRPHSYYVAGPGDMVIAVRVLLGSLGVADGAIYSEDHA